MLGPRTCVQLNLWHEIHAIALLKVLGCHRLEFTGKSILKCKETPFQEIEGIRELTLQSQEISEVKQTLVVIKVFLQKPH
jgi:hypothetical protein